MNKVKADVDDAIAKYPRITENIIDAYELMIDEIEAGESEENEIEHFYSNLSNLIEFATQKRSTNHEL